MGRDRIGVRAASATSIEISFQYDGQQCRERIKLKPTALNLAKAERHRQAILKAIAVGTFDYPTTFPKSKRARHYEKKLSSGVTVGRFLEFWWEREAPMLKTSTRTVDGRIVQNQLIRALGHIPLTEQGGIRTLDTDKQNQIVMVQCC